MNNIICHIVRRKIYAYLAEIIGGPIFWGGKWCLVVNVIWQDNVYPIRGMMTLKFDSKEDAERVKIGEKVSELEMVEFANEL